MATVLYIRLSSFTLCEAKLTGFLCKCRPAGSWMYTENWIQGWGDAPFITMEVAQWRIKPMWVTKMNRSSPGSSIFQIRQVGKVHLGSLAISHIQSVIYVHMGPHFFMWTKFSKVPRSVLDLLSILRTHWANRACALVFSLPHHQSRRS